MDNNNTPKVKDKWLKCISKSGRHYMFNQTTGESHWCKDESGKQSGTANPSPDIDSSSGGSCKTKTPAQDRLQRIQAKIKETRANEKSAIEKLGKVTMRDASKTAKPVIFHSNNEPPAKKPKVEMTPVSTTLPSLNIPDTPKSSLGTKRQVFLKGIETSKPSLTKLMKKKSSSPTTKTDKSSTKSNCQETTAKPSFISTFTESTTPSVSKSSVVLPNSNTTAVIATPAVPRKTIEKRKYKKAKRLLNKNEIPSTSPLRDLQPPNECLPPKDDKKESKPSTPLNANILPYQKGSANKRLALLQNELRQKLKAQSFTTLNGVESNINEKNTESDKSVYADCEPMDWEPMEVDNDDIKAAPVAASTETVNELIMGDYYDNVNENVMRLVSKRNNVREWKTDHFYFVIDTNVLLEYLTFIDDLHKMQLAGTNGTIIYLPYKVLQELDKLKDRPPSQSVKTRVVRAIKYLNKKFESKCENIQVQSERESHKKKVKETSPDDSIINCCIQVKENIENYIFLTEDINLRNKAITNDLLVSTKSQLVQFPM